MAPARPGRSIRDNAGPPRVEATWISRAEAQVISAHCRYNAQQPNTARPLSRSPFLRNLSPRTRTVRLKEAVLGPLPSRPGYFMNPGFTEPDEPWADQHRDGVHEPRVRRMPRPSVAAEVGELGELGHEGHLDRPDRTGAVLGHDHLGDSPLLGRLVVVLVPVDEHHDVGVLLE